MQRDAIWNRARADLAIPTKQGGQDVFLWEHSDRVARNVEWILNLPMVQAAAPDPASCVAAALYHDAGWAVRFAKGEVRREEILVCSISDTHRELGAELLERRLAKYLGPETRSRASEAIRALSDRRIGSIEGQVLADANNLDEFGLPSLWATIRRDALVGKGVQAMIDKWKRRKEYRFWEPRLNDSFRFQPVRTLAEERLEHFERFMEELQRQHRHIDPGAEPTTDAPRRSRDQVTS